jgi:hypothetical protein
MADHARLSPSSAARWLACPGSVAAHENLPDTCSSYADEGKRAHAIAESCLINNIDPMEYADTSDANMAEHIATYVNYVREIEYLK